MASGEGEDGVAGADGGGEADTAASAGASGPDESDGVAGATGLRAMAEVGVPCAIAQAEQLPLLPPPHLLLLPPLPKASGGRGVNRVSSTGSTMNPM